MNRREFLKLSLSKLALQGPIFLPHLQNNSTRFAILADTHWPMWEAERVEILAHLQTRPIEFLIIAGDVIHVEAEGGTAANYWQSVTSELANYEWLAVPGNHDLGTAYNKPDLYIPPKPEALAAWLGPKQWVKDLENIRIIGLDFFDWTPESQTWIAEQLTTEKRKVVISHYPLTGCQPKWYGAWDWWDWYHQEKMAFFQGVDLFICGHRHQFSLSQVGTMTHIICPPVAPVAGVNLPEVVPNGIFPMTYPMRGWLEIIESGGGLTIELWRSDGVKVWTFQG